MKIRMNVTKTNVAGVGDMKAGEVYEVEEQLGHYLVSRGVAGVVEFSPRRKDAPKAEMKKPPAGDFMRDFAAPAAAADPKPKLS